MRYGERVRGTAPILARVLTLLILVSVLGGAGATARPAMAPDRRVIYTYGYGLGFHPFTSPHDVRAQLTGNFWLFPVSGRCRGELHAGEECELLGGNPIRVEAVGREDLRIVTLTGHALGEGLHIRFVFARDLGFHTLTVRAWEPVGTSAANSSGGLSNRLLAWVLWRVLAETLSVSAYAA